MSQTPNQSPSRSHALVVITSAANEKFVGYVDDNDMALGPIVEQAVFRPTTPAPLWQRGLIKLTDAWQIIPLITPMGDGRQITGVSRKFVITGIDFDSGAKAEIWTTVSSGYRPDGEELKDLRRMIDDCADALSARKQGLTLPRKPSLVTPR